MKPNEKEREEIIKIINAHATVTVHIWTVTVAIVHKCRILHPMMWMFFGPKCVKGVTFSILQNFPQANVVALRILAIVGFFWCVMLLYCSYLDGFEWVYL